jgi:hypothetical protein
VTPSVERRAGKRGERRTEGPEKLASPGETIDCGLDRRSLGAIKKRKVLRQARQRSALGAIWDFREVRVTDIALWLLPAVQLELPTDAVHVRPEHFNL